MKKTIITLAVCLAAFSGVSAQEMTDAQKAAAAAAMAISEAPKAEKQVEKPKYWDESLKTNIKFGQTSLTNWAAGGDNTVTLAAFIDGNVNYKKNDLFWNNRLQLDYGFVYASSKPILQKSDDRIYFESKFGYKNEEWRKFFFSANFDFKSQFTTGFNYPTPAAPEGTKLEEMGRRDQVRLWKDARKMKSGFLSPAYTNLALGIDLKPLSWLSLNFAPATGGFVIVTNDALRKDYGMELVTKEEDMSADMLNKYKEAVEKANDGTDESKALLGEFYKGARFEFGTQLKADIAVKVNDNFAYTSQLVLFSNYLDHPENIRVNWDNRFDWKLAKYFSLTLTTNMIYDDKVMIFSEKDNLTKQRVQFKQSLLFGFTYTLARKR